MGDAPLRIDITIDQATEEWLARYSSANTRSAYASDLRAFLAWFGDESSALEVTPEAISQYRADDPAVPRTAGRRTKNPKPERS
jgi:hypothetical protein